MDNPPVLSNLDYLVMHSDLRRTFAENEDLKKQLAKLTDDLEDMKHDKRSYRASKERAEADLDVAKVNLDDARATIEDLTNKLEERDRDNAYLRRRMEEESQEDAKWFRMVDQLQAKVAELEADIRRRASPPAGAANVLGHERPSLEQPPFDGLAMQVEPTTSTILFTPASRPSAGAASGTPAVLGQLGTSTVPGHSRLLLEDLHDDLEMEADDLRRIGSATELPITLNESVSTPSTPKSALRIRIPSAAALDKLKRNNGLNGDYWTCFMTPDEDSRLLRRDTRSNASTPNSRRISRPLKRANYSLQLVAAGKRSPPKEWLYQVRTGRRRTSSANKHAAA